MGVKNQVTLNINKISLKKIISKNQIRILDDSFTMLIDIFFWKFSFFSWIVLIPSYLPDSAA